MENKMNRKKKFVVFRENEEIFYKQHPVNAIKVGEAQVATISGKKAILYKFEQGKWIEKGELNPYYHLEENLYLAVV